MTLNLSEKSQQIQQMFNTIAPRYDFLNRLLSLRQDVRWRNKMIALLPPCATQAGILYDVACGTGDVLFAIAQQRSDYQYFFGFDISQAMLDFAAKKISTLGKQKNIQLQLASAEHLPPAEASAHGVTIAFGLRNVDNRVQALREFYRVLMPGGSLLILEFFSPKHSLLQLFFQFYFHKILPAIAGLFSNHSAYCYLPQSVQTMYTHQQLYNTLKEVGFINIEVVKWMGGAVLLFHAKK